MTLLCDIPLHHLIGASNTFSFNIWEAFQNVGVSITLFLITIFRLYAILGVMEAQPLMQMLRLQCQYRPFQPSHPLPPV